MSTVEIVETKIKELQEGLQKKNSFLSSINEALKKLAYDKESTISEINTIQGAIHAYSECSKLLKETKQEIPSG